MKVHKLKLQEQFVKAVLHGQKSWELRNDDRHFKVGDIIVFTDLEGNYYRQFMKVPANCKTPKDYKPSPRTYEITYKLDGFTGLEKGYCILSIRETAYTLNEIEHLIKIGWSNDEKAIIYEN